MKRWIVPGLPFLFSLCLSLATAGSHPYWQDSGLYLTAVKGMGVLYPPGFGLYLVLCKFWTLLLFFLDFTLAVHLFSSFCAAAAAGTIAVAVRDLLRSRGKTFTVTDQDPGEAAGWCGILAGLILAAGYTFWSAAIYAKGYSLYYLILALLLWRMIRADESGKPRDFTLVAALIGLAWQVHPSASLLGLSLVAFVAVHARTLGARGVAGRIGVAAAAALGPSCVILPILMARDPWLRMGHPDSVAAFAKYVSGQRFVQLGGVFGYDASRAASFGRFLWEEMLGVGLLLAVAGLVVLARRNRRLLAGILLWMVPYAMVTILFKIEGQHDCWFVASWLPLSLALGVGAWEIARRAGPQAAAVLGGAGLVAVAWAVSVNFSQVSQRDYDLAELYGKTLLQPVDRDSILVLSGDDPNALTAYLQQVRGERPDVTLVTASFLLGRATGAGRDWYEESLLRRHPFLAQPDYETTCRNFPKLDLIDAAIAAFVNANAGAGRPLFVERPILPGVLRPEIMLAPAGALWKVVPRGGAPELDVRYWRFPVEPEQVRLRVRRERGQNVQYTPEGVTVKPQAYEWRLISLLLRARVRLAMARVELGQYGPAATLFESVLAVDPELRSNGEIIHFLGVSYYASGLNDRAEPLLRQSSTSSGRPEWRATALFYRGEIARKKGDEASARRLYQEALATPGIGEANRAEIEKQLKPP